jgi:hypothetical protein
MFQAILHPASDLVPCNTGDCSTLPATGPPSLGLGFNGWRHYAEDSFVIRQQADETFFSHGRSNFI